MSEVYAKEDLANAFNKALQDHPKQQKMLVELWNDIKNMQPTQEETRKVHSCQHNCDSCLLNEQCDMFDKAKLLFEHYSAIQETDAYWSDFVRNSTRYTKKYKDHRFARILAQAVLEEISETAKSLPEYQNWAVEVERR